MKPPPAQSEWRKKLISITQLFPNNIALYQEALCHSSSMTSNIASNERLEFLGDAVLNLVISNYLYQYFPNKEEGFLTKTRANFVNRERMHQLAMKIGIPEILRIKKGLDQNKQLKYIYGNALEALIGAVFLDQGYAACEEFVLHRLFIPHFDLNELITTDANFKTKLLEWAQKRKVQVRFEIEEKQTEDKRKVFYAEVYVDRTLSGGGAGDSKKKASQKAAKKACDLLKIS